MRSRRGSRQTPTANSTRNTAAAPHIVNPIRPSHRGGQRRASPNRPNGSTAAHLGTWSRIGATVIVDSTNRAIRREINPKSILHERDLK
ncbi:hypothetical protein GCM10009612_51410 [Streptomyces beijiangensis]